MKTASYGTAVLLILALTSASEARPSRFFGRKAPMVDQTEWKSDMFQADAHIASGIPMDPSTRAFVIQQAAVAARQRAKQIPKPSVLPWRKADPQHPRSVLKQTATDLNQLSAAYHANDQASIAALQQKINFAQPLGPNAAASANAAVASHLAAFHKSRQLNTALGRRP